MSNKGKKNVYLCKDCGHGYVSQDVDDGVTPFNADCLNCAGMAQSCFYKIPQDFLAFHAPAVEWYAPSEEDLKALLPMTRAHCDKGGLLSRRTGAGK